MNKQELARRIVRDMGYEYQTVKNIIDGIAFEGWLHNPNQVPGRTITRSTMHELIGEHFYTPVREIDVEAYTEALGRLVVPEPTNAQSLSKLLEEFAQLNASCGGEQGDHDLAEFLDSRGVRAGSDD